VSDRQSCQAQRILRDCEETVTATGYGRRVLNDVKRRQEYDEKWVPLNLVYMKIYLMSCRQNGRIEKRRWIRGVVRLRVGNTAGH
jgi:hypothetical protein